MEGNLASENTFQGNTSYGNFDLQEPIRVNHHQQNSLALHPRQGLSIIHPAIHENFPLANYNKNAETIKSPSDEDEPSFAEEVADKGKKASPWHRVKWTENMVLLLITSVSYISDEAASEYSGSAKRKCVNLQKKGKWKSVSKVLAEKGHFVSPQQCEDKFNDLNKRYKRLNEILGRGTSCEVVENPTLLDVLDNITEKSKEEVRKILSSKHLHYEEMCSYHNGNRLHLPHDPELQRSLRLALRNRDDHDENDRKKHLHDENDEVEQEAEYEDRDEYEEHQSCVKRVKQCKNHEDFSFKNPTSSFNIQAENTEIDANLLENAGLKANMSQKEWMTRRKLQLEEQRLQIEVQMLDLEHERFKWQRFCRKKDQELEMMKMEIEKTRLENERMALELRHKEMDI